MKNVFVILAGFVLLAPAILASPFPGGDGGHGKCLPQGAPCGSEYDKMKCCGECKVEGGKDKHGGSKMGKCYGGKPDVCIPLGGKCGGDKGKCCGGYECKHNGKDKRGLDDLLCCVIKGLV